MSPQPIMVRGMSGLGDNLHQRAFLKRWAAQGIPVWIETPWPVVYQDLPGVRCMRRVEILRTQAKNAARQMDAFSHEAPPREARTVHFSYSRDLVHSEGSVLGAMAKTVGEPMDGLDFSLPIPKAWRVVAEAMTRGRGDERPLMIYRPLVERTEWGGCKSRNPDFDAYRDLFEAIRRDYFVISIADLADGVEWTVGHRIRSDMQFHRGELSLEVLAGLISISALTYCSPGFAVILSQAVHTPAACVFGGYETTTSFAGGATFSPTLSLGPHPGCGCFSHHHPCQKAFDVLAARLQLEDFSKCQSEPFRRPMSPTSTGPGFPAAISTPASSKRLSA